MEHIQVPGLMNILKKIVCDQKEYCFVCLRTADERRLVTPIYFRKFLGATKMDMNGPDYYVCYMCEQQASNAYKLFRAVVFASSLSLIVEEMSTKQGKNKRMIDNNYFQRVLNRTGLNGHLSAATISSELESIRKHSFLSETDTLVMDNQQVYESSPPTPEVAVPPRRAGRRRAEPPRAAPQPPPQHPPQPPPQHPPRAAPWKRRPAKKPDVDITPNTITTPETYVILDDDDDPLNLRTELQPPPNPTTTIAQNPPNPVQPSTNLVVTADPPKIVTLDDLLQDKNVAECPNFLLHPIFLGAAGRLHVPSLAAEIINGSLVYHNTVENSITRQPLAVNIEMVKENLKSNKEVFIQNSHNYILPNNGLDLSCGNTIEGCPTKKMKIGGNLTDSNNIGSVTNFKISDISSDLDNEAPKGNKGTDNRTDWEDKIPMDVISFMDAVDPNADKLLKSKTPETGNTMVIGQVRSLAQTRSAESEVIDLC